VTLRSALYVGSVMHRRLRPRRHRFRFQAYWLLLDLDELDALSRRLRWFSYNRANAVSLHDADHGDGSATPIRVQVARRLAAEGIELGGGRVQLFCMPRTLGYCFNPLSVYFCRRADGALAAVIYQVHNTFGARHSYVLRVSDDGAIRQHCRKSFYVSPFLDMDLRYDFRVIDPDARIVIGIRASDAEGAMLDAVLAGTRAPLTDSSLARAFLRLPLVSLKVMAAIHWEALKLWAKGIRYRSPPPAPMTSPTPQVPAS
jgi:DUF1365 family protein